MRALCIAALLLAGCAPSYDPLAAAREAGKGLIGNVEAGIPPQCYTKTGAASNPCWVCHTEGNGRNQANDWELQGRYDFSEMGRTNHWTNLFKDRRAQIEQIDDAAILSWIRQDNYSALRAVMARFKDFPGWRPDLDYPRGFDDAGFARDGSGWRAFRYKPFPGTFWPTNGSTDTAMIRLPAAFRSDASGKSSQDIYESNLDIVASAVAAEGPLPKHYLGAAANVPVVRYEYPEGTEFLHPVHYVDPDAPDLRAARLKEVRYSRKEIVQDDTVLKRRYDEEALEQTIGGRPHYAGNAFTGQSNDFGWLLQGYIEDAQGRLRLQTREEQLFCMGCHTGIGVTVDQTFSLPRKLPGSEGWGLQRVGGQRDAPQAGSREPEYQTYLKRVGGGDEFRANSEMIERYFERDKLKPEAVRAAQSGEMGLLGLIAPSRERALALNKAYLLIVREQSYRYGRDAVLAPAENVHQQLENTDTALKASGQTYRDGRLWLNWD